MLDSEKPRWTAGQNEMLTGLCTSDPVLVRETNWAVNTNNTGREHVEACCSGIGVRARLEELGAGVSGCFALHAHCRFRPRASKYMMLFSQKRMECCAWREFRRKFHVSAASLPDRWRLSFIFLSSNVCQLVAALASRGTSVSCLCILSAQSRAHQTARLFCIFHRGWRYHRFVAFANCQAIFRQAVVSARALLYVASRTASLADCEFSSAGLFCARVTCGFLCVMLKHWLDTLSVLGMLSTLDCVRRLSEQSHFCLLLSLAFDRTTRRHSKDTDDKRYFVRTSDIQQQNC